MKTEVEQPTEFDPTPEKHFSELTKGEKFLLHTLGKTHPDNVPFLRHCMQCPPCDSELEQYIKTEDEKLGMKEE